MEKRSIKRKSTPWERSQNRWGWIFVLPTIAGLMILNIVPMFMSLYQTFFKTGDFGRGNIFIGGKNYETLLRDPEVWQAVLNTFKYTLVEVPLSIVLALVFAVLLNRRMRGRGVYRAIFFLPMVVAPAAVAMVWRWLYNSQFGLINNLLHINVQWISDSRIAWLSIGIIGVWSVVGYNMILFLAGLQDIPRDYYEAAQTDGASGVFTFFHITLPLLSPTIFFVLVTRVIGGMQVFDLIYMVEDRTSPALKQTQSIVYLFYRYSFINQNKGYGATIVILLLVIVLIMTAVQMYLQKKWVFYS